MKNEDNETDDVGNAESAEGVAAFVRRTAPQILTELEPDDLLKLQDRKFCKQKFKLGFAFLRRADEISNDENQRYNRKIFNFAGMQYRITGEWYERNRSPYRAWLEARGIASDDAPESATPSLRRSARTGVRWRAARIGNAQNAFVRHLLSTLGEDTFGEDDWRKTRAHFGDACAYCGETGKLVIGHAVPMNRTALGEHRLGNIVPACASCNGKKGDSDHRAFCEDTPDRLAVIEAWMTSCNYRPRSEDEILRALLALAHEEIGSVANRWRDILANIPNTD